MIYVGTFTKMLFNTLRIGFLVLPERIVEALTSARFLIDRHSPTLEQAILAEFIFEGHFGHHIRRMREIYTERAGVLVESVKNRLTGRLKVDLAPSGMRTIGWLLNKENDQTVAGRARAQGLEITALSQFAIRSYAPGGLILGFAACTPGELRRGVDVLASVMD